MHFTVRNVNLAICQGSWPALEKCKYLPIKTSTQHPYFLHKLHSQPYLVPSCMHSGSLRNLTWGLPHLLNLQLLLLLLVSLPNSCLYSALRSGSCNTPTSSSLPWEALASADLRSQLFQQIWPYPHKREMCETMCQGSSRGGIENHVSKIWCSVMS